MRGREVCRVAQDHVDVVVVVHRVVVEQHEIARTRLSRDVHRVVDRAVAPVPLRLVLLVRVLRVVDQQVDAVAQLEHLLRNVVVGIVGIATRAVVGDVRDRHAVPVDAVAERRADVAHPTRPHLGEPDREVVVARVVEPNVAASCAGVIGKNGGHMSCANTSPSGPSAWRGP